MSKLEASNQSNTQRRTECENMIKSAKSELEKINELTKKSEVMRSKEAQRVEYFEIKSGL